MSHYRTEIYGKTKARLEGASLVAAGRVSIERVEPVTCRTAAEAADELPVINLVCPRGNRERTTETEPFKGTCELEVEIMATGTSTEAVAAARDELCENVENLLLDNVFGWTGGTFKATGVADTVSQSQDGDVLAGFAKLTFTLEIATTPAHETEDMLELVNVDVQTTEPDDDTTEMSFVAEPSVVEEAA